MFLSMYCAFSIELEHVQLCPGRYTCALRVLIPWVILFKHTEPCAQVAFDMLVFKYEFGWVFTRISSLQVRVNLQPG